MAPARLIADRLLGKGYRIAMACSAVAIWIEPLRSTFDYGQVNVLLVLAGLCAVYTTRWWAQKGKNTSVGSKNE